MAVRNKLDWLRQSSVKDRGSFSNKVRHIYTDVSLDFKQSTSKSIDKNAVLSSVVNRNRDVECIYDTECIVHSLYEIMRTPKKTRPLVPEFGSTLYEYIGKAITDLTCESICTMLKYDIETWEPRVTVMKIDAIPYHDESTIKIELQVRIPEITKTTLLQYEFNSINGYITPLNEKEI